jgi:hypothetical protein
MHILTDAVLSSIKPCGCGYWYFGNLTNFEANFLRTITQRQRHKFKKFGMVPEQFLKIAFDYGWLPGSAPPKGGMKVKRLLDLLDAGRYRDAENREMCLWFRGKIIEEWMASSSRKPRKDRRYFYVKLS